MPTRFRRWMTGTSLACALVLGTQARGQSPSPSPTIGPPPASLTTNPYANPAMNPMMNPMLAANGSINQSNAWMYLWTANQRAGGLASGRLNSSRPAPSQMQAPRLNRGRAAAEMPVSLKRPGGAANGYFNRGMGSNNPQRAAFGRQNRYFANNGR